MLKINLAAQTYTTEPINTKYLLWKVGNYLTFYMAQYLRKFSSLSTSKLENCILQIKFKVTILHFSNIILGTDTIKYAFELAH
jgi:hypothetical protein